MYPQSVEVYYEAEDLFATHNLRHWQVEHVRSGTDDAAASSEDDSDDETSLAVLYNK